MNAAVGASIPNLTRPSTGASHAQCCTGTSTGIGWRTAKVLIARGFRVFGSVRKKDDAERLSAEFGGAFVPLVFDVTDEDAVGLAAARVGEALAGEKLFGLVPTIADE